MRRLNAEINTSKSCAACGARAKRAGARYCLVCGKSMKEDYQPLDTIRASYGLQGKPLQFEKQSMDKPGNLFEENRNTVSHTAWACVVYSMVPYLGVLFIPFAFVIGSAGFVAAYRRPQLGGKKLAIVCVGLTFIILGIQIALWWLLYVIPRLTGAAQ